MSTSKLTETISTYVVLGVSSFLKKDNSIAWFIIFQTSGKISVTDYVRITSTEWYVITNIWSCLLTIHFKHLFYLLYFWRLFFDSSISSKLLSCCTLTFEMSLRSSARIFNIYPKKGAILPGSDADIIILNPNSSFQISSNSHHSRSDTNVYEGWIGKVIFHYCLL